MKRNSGVIGPLKKTNTEAAKGVHDLHDVHIKRSDDKWPRAGLFINLQATPTTVTEGNQVVFTLTTEHIPDGTTLYYTINTVSGTTMVDADFDNSPAGQGIDGSFTTTNDSTTLTFGVYADGITESGQQFRLEIRRGSVAGEVEINSTNISVTDAALAVGTNITSNFYEISNRIIYSPSTQDYTGNWDVGEIQQSSSGSFRVYLCFKVTASTTYYNDICVAAVQVLTSGGAVKQTWNWSGGSSNSWQTVTVRVTQTSSLLSSQLTPYQAANNYTYPGVVSSTNNTTRVGIATGTGSSYTGMADGIANSTTTAYTVGNNQVAQSSGAFYIYAEVSGAARYSFVTARSPAYTFSSGDRIRVVHAVTTRSGQPVNINDSLWIGLQ